MKEKDSKEIKVEKTQDVNPNKVKTIVKFNKNNEAYFEINSYGFKFPSDKQRGENITVYFEGEFLTESFKIVDVK